MFRESFSRESLSNSRRSTRRCQRFKNNEQSSPYCKSALRPRPFPATKSSKETFDCWRVWLSARAIRTSLCSSGIVRLSNGEDDHSISLMSATAKSPIYSLISFHRHRSLSSNYLPHILSPKEKPGTVGQQIRKSLSFISVGTMSAFFI
jgi:hypothetical protein